MCRRVLSACASAAMLATVSACADGAGDSAGETLVRDSAGVSIVATGQSAPAVLMLSTEPLLEIGELEGAEEYQLHNVRHATRMSDGTTVIANTGSMEIRYYDRSGQHVRTTGRRGGGPGEFEFISYMRRLEGDSLLVYDARNRRLTIFDPEGVHVRDFTPGGTDNELLAGVAAATADGTLLVTGGRSFPPGSVEYHRDTLHYSVQRGDSLVPLRSYLGMEAGIVTQGGGGNMMTVMISSVPFGRDAYASAGADRFYIGSSDTYEVHTYDTTGALVGIIRSAHVAPREVTTELFEQYVAATLDRRARFAEEQGMEFDLAAVKKQVEGSTPAPAVPMYSDLLAADDGGVWVKDYSMPGIGDQPDRWTVFAADGRMRGVIDLPPRFEPLHVVGDTVTGVITDEYDVEYVRVYTISQ